MPATVVSKHCVARCQRAWPFDLNVVQTQLTELVPIDNGYGSLIAQHLFYTFVVVKKIKSGFQDEIFL